MTAREPENEMYQPRYFLIRTIDYCIDLGSPYDFVLLICLILFPFEILFISSLISSWAIIHCGIIIGSIIGVIGIIILCSYFALMVSLLRSDFCNFGSVL